MLCSSSWLGRETFNLETRVRCSCRAPILFKEFVIEAWKDVVGFEEYFMISDRGRVWSKRSNKILKQTLLQTGYWSFATKIGGRNGSNHCLRIHRLIAEAFIPNPEDKPFINHKNGIKTDNTLSNLEWCTNQENIQHAWDNDLITPVNVETEVRSDYTVDFKKKVAEEYKSSGKTSREIGEKYRVAHKSVLKWFKYFYPDSNKS